MIYKGNNKFKLEKDSFKKFVKNSSMQELTKISLKLNEFKEIINKPTK